MNPVQPIYSEKTECQDCYKCLRHCPVKAIRIQQGSAVVMPEACMCVSYMRRLAQHTANALIRTIPFGVVLVDAQLNVVEANEAFVHLMGPNVEAIHLCVPGLKGGHLNSVREFLLDRVAREPDLSARQLSRCVVARAEAMDHGVPSHDMTCMVFHFRKPRQLLLVSGPPYARAQDGPVARRLKEFDGRTVVCGGTTANIVARELNCEVVTDISHYDRDVPAPSQIGPIDLVTEGMLTLDRAVAYLKGGLPDRRTNAATQLVEMLLESDDIHVVVGTSVNAAHQDPSLPVTLDIRRNVFERLIHLLTEKYMKQVHVEYV